MGPCGSQPRGAGSCPEGDRSESFPCFVCPPVYLKVDCLDLVDLLSEEKGRATHSLVRMQILPAWLLSCVDIWVFLGPLDN